MTKETYEALSDKEKLIYDEFTRFTVGMTNRIDGLTLAMKKLLDLATHDP